MTKCEHWDCGWCYAPDDVKTNALGSGACNLPEYCPYLKSQNQMPETSMNRQVKETQRYYGGFDGSLESIISRLQSELDDGWEGIETEYERDYGDHVEDHEVYYLYKHREETDKEYDKRMKQLEKKKVEKVKAKEKKLNQLKKELSSLSDADKKLLGL